MRFVALAALLLAALVGCAPVTPVPKQPTGDELDRLIAQELELQWQYVGLTPDSPRPTVERIRLVSMDEAEAVHRQCMVDAGYENFRLTEAAIFGGASTSERLAIYICSAQYPVPPSSYGLLSEAQLGYLYDYYIEVTVPCLESTGIDVTEVPDREQFVDSKTDLFTMWNPYSALGEQKQVTYLAQSKCSYVPEGFNLF